MSDIPLPAFLDPLLDYLEENLPPQLYSFIASFLSHFLDLLTALVSLVSSVIASKPWEWDAQTIIPPLISLLAAYLALVSLYRTTSWLFRTTFWFIKWGTIIAVFVAGAGWYIGNQDGDAGGRGFSSRFGAVLDALNGVDRDGAGARFPEVATSRTPNHHRKPRESSANQWEHYEGIPAHLRNDAQQIMSEIATMANRILVEGGWWNVAKSVFTQTESQSREERRSQRRGNQSSRR